MPKAAKRPGLTQALGTAVNSWDRFKIIEKLKIAADQYSASNLQQQEQLIFSCGNAAPTEVFFGLLPFFYDQELQENHYERQRLAALTLLTLATPSVLELDASVYATAQHWNLSVEELPWYWCKIFGKSEVVAFLTDLIGSCSDPKLKRSVETMLYWSQRYTEGST